MARGTLCMVIDAFQVKPEMNNADLQALTGLTTTQVSSALTAGVKEGVIKAAVYLPPRHYLWTLTDKPYRQCCVQCQEVTLTRHIKDGMCPECFADEQCYQPLVNADEQKFNKFLRLPFGLSPDYYHQCLNDEED
ncbi:hypothetical protein [Vibrio mediterranei]|uniref:hypothetical protein n=1 Tax=Vibrio mediterranei TaxID=689 RepID=UPI002284AC9D|nr:hypothetical protein [Vibrio mediterranei]MCY9855434.1 hypothetical protein [Vibrio mediterranei]